MINADQSNRSSISRAWSWCSANRHFMIAAIILAITAGGWSLAVEMLEIWTHKEPVPWPEVVKVNNETFQIISLPERMGPFKLVDDRELPEDILEALKIGTTLDKARVDARRSNWYSSRVYIDTRPDSKFREWSLGLYYYTGGLDKVPHVGRVCLVASGATIQDASLIDFTAPNARGPWNAPTAFEQTRYSMVNRKTGQELHYLQYEGFVVNGQPETDRLAVRAKLMNPWVGHCYFAKMQFGPRGRINDIEEARKAAEEFVKEFLPHVLDTLPTGQSVKQLDDASKNQ